MTEATKPRFVVAPAIRPYQPQWLRADILAGLAAAAVVIPQAMAYATVADMPVQFGLYTCMLPLVVYAFIGGSRTASVSVLLAPSRGGSVRLDRNMMRSC